jgi:hypothetical protein
LSQNKKEDDGRRIAHHHHTMLAEHSIILNSTHINISTHCIDSAPHPQASIVLVLKIPSSISRIKFSTMRRPSIRLAAVLGAAATLSSSREVASFIPPSPTTTTTSRSVTRLNLEKHIADM